jgi:hypothetical protein
MATARGWDSLPLQELFNPEISQLEQMLDWDLRHWR